MTSLIAGATVGCALLGFLAGLFSFKVKQQWCRECGNALRCPMCHRRAAPTRIIHSSWQ